MNGGDDEDNDDGEDDDNIKVILSEYKHSVQRRKLMKRNGPERFTHSLSKYKLLFKFKKNNIQQLFFSSLKKC